MPGANAAAVSRRRRKIKTMLVAEAGGKCADCRYVGPPFMFDFDHRDPSTKTHSLSGAMAKINSIAACREEAAKCDLVCALCHRMRTHRQRCTGCDHCNV